MFKFEKRFSSTGQIYLAAECEMGQVSVRWIHCNAFQIDPNESRCTHKQADTQQASLILLSDPRANWLTGWMAGWLADGESELEAHN